MAEFEFNIRDIFRVTRRRKWILILAPVLVGALTYLLSQNLTCPHERVHPLS